LIEIDPLNLFKRSLRFPYLTNSLTM